MGAREIAAVFQRSSRTSTTGISEKTENNKLRNFQMDYTVHCFSSNMKHFREN